jgi:hypothetical protein
MLNKTQLLNTIRYNACQIKIEAAATTATLSNYDYLLNLSKRMDAIESAVHVLSRFGILFCFGNSPVANLITNSIHRTMVALIPSFGLGDFDWEGTGEDLTRLVHGAWVVLRDCGEDGLAQSICDRHNLFVTMCEMQEKLDEQWLTDLAND